MTQLRDEFRLFEDDNKYVEFSDTGNDFILDVNFRGMNKSVTIPKSNITSHFINWITLRAGTRSVPIKIDKTGKCNCPNCNTFLVMEKQ